jgi:hypothetical protein
MEAKEEALYSKIGQVTFERDWLKKKSIELFGEGYEEMFTDKPE